MIRNGGQVEPRHPETLTRAAAGHWWADKGVDNQAGRHTTNNAHGMYMLATTYACCLATHATQQPHQLYKHVFLTYIVFLTHRCDK